MSETPQPLLHGTGAAARRRCIMNGRPRPSGSAGHLSNRLHSCSRHVPRVCNRARPADMVLGWVHSSSHFGNWGFILSMISAAGVRVQHQRFEPPPYEQRIWSKQSCPGAVQSQGR